MGMYKRALERMAEKRFNPYDTYRTLVNYHATGPDPGRLPQASADWHLTLALADAISRQKQLPSNNKFNGNLSFIVPDAGADAPLGDYIDAYAKHFLDSYRGDIKGFGEHRAMFFGPGGKPLMLQDLDSKDFIFPGGAYKKGMTGDELRRAYEDSRNKAVFILALAASKKHPNK